MGVEPVSDINTGRVANFNAEVHAIMGLAPDDDERREGALALRGQIPDLVRMGCDPTELLQAIRPAFSPFH